MGGEDTELDLDDELMRSIASGDARALDELFLRHRDGVFRLAYRYMGSRAEAEDLTQDTFLRVLSSASGYRPEGSFKTWLLTITTRLCLNRKSRHTSWKERLIGLFHPDRDSGASETEDPAELALRGERAYQVQRAVSALPDEQRIAILLSRFEGLSYDEISAVMGKSVQSVTSLLWRARVRLREELAPLVDEEFPESKDPRARNQSAAGLSGKAE